MKPKYGVLPLVAGAATALVCALPARADVVGRLKIVVKNADTEKPVSGATITLKDSANVRPDTVLTPDATTGEATTDPLENRAFIVSVTAAGFETFTQNVTVIPDTTTDVDILLEPVEKTIRITGSRTSPRQRTTTNSTTRDSGFIARFPVAAGNPQQLQGLIAATPGVALDSNNQAHPRGEHTQTSIYIGGFQLGGALAGRFGPLIVPDALESVEVQTGAFAPEYGSETAAILNTTIKQGTIRRTFSLNAGAGGFATRQGSLSFGGQFGGSLLRRSNVAGENNPTANTLPAPAVLNGPTGTISGNVGPANSATNPLPGTPNSATGGPTGTGTFNQNGVGTPNTAISPNGTTANGTTNGATASGTATDGTTPGAVTNGASTNGATINNNGAQSVSPEQSAPRPGDIARKFRYFFNTTTRSTDNALDPPQPDFQNAHNKGNAQSYIGRFDFLPSSKDTFTLTLDAAPARSGVSNRAGLPDKYAGVGQGFGYAGAVSRADALASGNPLLAQTQQQAGQDINQKDDNRFGILQYRHTFSDQLTGLLSFGATRSQLDVTNRNPGVYQDITTLGQRPDAAIEFSPTVSRKGNNSQVEGSLTYSVQRHSLKAGFLNDQQKGQESYNLIPGSQLALNSLFSNAPQLAGFVDGATNNLGTPQVDAKGAPVLDANGQQVYTLNPGVSALPTVNESRKGYYRAFYAQDTWRVTSRLTANYGVRLDSFSRTETSGASNFALKKNFLGPRVNLSYGLRGGYVVRTSYNRLFIQPPISQGATVGSFAQPETLNQYETSLEKQLSPRSSVKLAYYYKQIRNQLDIALLVPGSQIGIYRAVNIPNDGVHGLELSYDFTPRNNVGLGGFLAAARSVARYNNPDGTQSFNDHDQRYTVSSGLDYTLRNGASAALTGYYGSGTASSAIDGGIGSVFTGKRTSRTRVNARLSSGPQLFKGRGGLNLDVENVFDNRALINFASDFSGTRFQQGRRVVLSAFASF